MMQQLTIPALALFWLSAGVRPLPAGRYEFPWLVRVTAKFSANFRQSCTGALIEDFQWVLTEAHCLRSLNPMARNRLENATSVSLLFGKFDLNSGSSNATEFRTESWNIFVHPNFSHVNYRHDFALIKLDNYPIGSQTIWPIRLPQDCSSFNQSSTSQVDNCSIGVSMGWLSLLRNQSNPVRKYSVNLYSFELCSEANGGLNTFSPNLQFCGAIQGSSLPQQPDGECSSNILPENSLPFACLDRNQQRYQLLGLSSFLADSPSSPPNCLLPVVFARVCAVLPWLRLHIPTPQESYFPARYPGSGCDHPPDVDNAEVQLSNEPWLVGTKRTFSCLDGFWLIGNGTVHCRAETGEWVQSGACIGLKPPKISEPTVEPSKSFNGTFCEHGAFGNVLKVDTETSIEAGSVLVLHCLNDSETSTEVRCLENGTWSIDLASVCSSNDTATFEDDIMEPSCEVSLFAGAFRCAQHRSVCISYSLQCNGRDDCDDGSDELNCSVLAIPPDSGNVNNAELLQAVLTGRSQTVRFILQEAPLFSDLDLDSRDSTGANALIIAAKSGNSTDYVTIVELLLNHSTKGTIDVDSSDKSGWTALIWASFRGFSNIARTLLDHGADVNAEADNGWRALWFATRYGQIDTAKLLVSRGADTFGCAGLYVDICGP